MAKATVVAVAMVVVNAPFTCSGRVMVTAAALMPTAMDQPPASSPDDLSGSAASPCGSATRTGGTSPVIGGRAIVRDAEAMAAEFGVDAPAAAALRAAHSRAQDNPYSYCQWQEVARVLDWMADGPVIATRH